LIPDIEKLSRKIEYTFNNENLLLEALTHRSVGAVNNERLEFLGDSVLNFVVAEQLFASLPKASEGDLSRLRASVVKKESLVEIAHDLQLGDFISLGSGELKSGGFRRESILADAVEAILGAVLRDSGFDECKLLVLRLCKNKIEQTIIDGPEKDAKTRLQEYLQSRRYRLPEYNVTDIKGKAHQQTFSVECFIKELDLHTNGVGRSRRIAEQEAAQKAIESIEKNV
jgi:ribonuclease III